LKEKTKKIFLFLLKVILTLGLFLYLFFYVNPDAVEKTFARADFRILLLVLILLVLNIYVQFKRWGIVARKILGITDGKQILSSLFHGFTAGIITPFRAGEFFARKIPFPQGKTSDIVVATFIDKFFLMPVIFFAGGVFALAFVFAKLNLAPIVAYSLAVLFLIAVFFLWNLYAKFERAKKLFRKFFPSWKFSEKIFRRLEILKRLDKKTAWSLLLLSALLYLIYTTQFALIIFSFEGARDFRICFWISNLVIFAKNFIPPITFGEVGVREAFTIYFVAAFGIQSSVGFNAAFMIFLINVLLPAVAGLYFVIGEKR